MKTKPNTEQFKPQKDPSAFLDGGAGDAADRTVAAPQKEFYQAPTPQSMPEAKVYREQKIFRLPLELINALKREAYERSVKTGNRVTETELVEQALKAFLSI
jgi:hypothetical protein